MSHSKGTKMNKSEDLQTLTRGHGSKNEAKDLISLTKDLKNDSLLNPHKERRSTGPQRVCRCSQIKMLREKTLEKIRMSMEVEKRSTVTDDQSFDSLKDKQQNSSNEHNIKNVLVEPKTKGKALNESTRKSYKKPAESISPKESSKNSSKFLFKIEKPHKISDFPPGRQSIRILTVQDDDIFEDIDKFHEKEQERIQARKSSKESRYTEIFNNDICGSFDPLLDEELDKNSKRSSKEQRYSNIYDNDMFGMPVNFVESAEFLNRDQLKLATLESPIYVDSSEVGKNSSCYHSSLGCVEDSSKKTFIQLSKQDFINDILDSIGLNTKATQTRNENGSGVSIVTIPQTKFHVKRSTVNKRYTDVLENDMADASEQQIKAVESSVDQKLDLLKIPKGLIVEDLKCQTSKEQSHNEISSNNLSGFINDVTSAASGLIFVQSEPKINQEKKVEHALTSYLCSMGNKICTDSCTSHLKAHSCSLEAPSCSPSCFTCKPNTDSFQRSSAHYDADDERSSLLLLQKNLEYSSSSSIKPQQDQTSQSLKIQNTERVCSCSQKCPVLFKNVLSK